MALGLAILLGAVQGLTEFLPISSSGHLRLMAAVFGVDDPQTLFDVCVHAGTLGAVLAVFGGEALRITAGFLKRPRWSEPGFRLGVLVLLGTLPAGIVGVTVGRLMEAHLATVATVGGFLLLNGVILMAGRGRGEGGRTIDELTVRDALLVGTAQAFAIFRGISRSGSTIVAGVGVGIERNAAATFSFLLSIPAIAGALALELGDALAEGAVEAPPLVAGTLAAAVVGYAALVVLLRVVRRGQLHHFAWYCWALGAFALAWVVAT